MFIGDGVFGLVFVCGEGVVFGGVLLVVFFFVLWVLEEFVLGLWGGVGFVLGVVEGGGVLVGRGGGVGGEGGQKRVEGKLGRQAGK